MDMAPYDLAGKAVLITGATDGLGRGVAREVAAAGGTALVHGRSPERIDATLAEVPGARGYRADLASLAQVRDLAAHVRDNEPRVDVLVNNAGIGTGERELSQDGYELRFAVNYLAGFLLTRELLSLLEASAPARIVNVASAGQMPIDFDDVMLERDYSGVRAYCQSKLAQIMFTIDLAERLDGAGVTVNSLHPATYMPTKIVSSPVSTLEEGVDATLRLVADQGLDGVSGRYFNGLREAAPDPQADDPQARRQLRELSEKLVGAA
jgi:NAD(P)-dependent dehydrogenase (short-subunit alcohol dehydrogenase family)